MIHRLFFELLAEQNKTFKDVNLVSGELNNRIVFVFLINWCRKE